MVLDRSSRRPTQSRIRVGDSITYWLAYLHFAVGAAARLRPRGRANRRSSGVGTVRLVPAAMFGTGAVMWWNRVSANSSGTSAGKASPLDVIYRP